MSAWKKRKKLTGEEIRHLLADVKIIGSDMCQSHDIRIKDFDEKIKQIAKKVHDYDTELGYHEEEIKKLRTQMKKKR